MSVAYLVQNLDERGVLLSVDVLQLDGDIVYLLEGLGAEEVGGVVVRLQQLFVLRCDDRSELSQVANHQQLHAAKWQAMVAEAPQHVVNGIQQVGPDHGYLVDDKQVDGGNNLALVASEVEATLHLRPRDVGRKRQLKERMDGDATGIDGCHPRGSYDDGALAGAFYDGLEEGGLARSGFSRQKDATPRILYEVPCCP